MGNIESSNTDECDERQPVLDCSPTRLVCVLDSWKTSVDESNIKEYTDNHHDDDFDAMKEKAIHNVGVVDGQNTSSQNATSGKNVNTPNNSQQQTGGQCGPNAVNCAGVGVGRDVRTQTKNNNFATNLRNQTGQYRRGNDFIMITDALSDVRANYHIDPKEIGHGHYGVVRKCMHRVTHEWYAIKSIRKSKVSKYEVLKREIEILKEVKHPNIIELTEVHEDERYLHLITELCTGGELFDRIIAKTQCAEGHFSEHDAAKLIADITDAIRYCHENGIVHRDLKPENFLFKTKAEDSPIKIIDFGLSRHHDDAKFGIMKTKVGTPYYVAPEVLRREYTKSCDIWSIGVITYILLCGYPPFYGDSDTQIFECVRTGRFDFPSPEWDYISPSAKHFVSSLLLKDPNHRPSASKALDHIWIKEQLGVNELPSERKKRQVGVKHSRVSRTEEFSKYLAMQKLKKAALGFVASNLSQAQVGNLESIFREVDTEGNGRLTIKELDRAISRLGDNAEIQENFRELREQLRANTTTKTTADATSSSTTTNEEEHEQENGIHNTETTIDWKDFLTASMDKSIALREDNIRSAFNHFKLRTDNSDHLDFNDLTNIFGNSTKAQVQEVMDFLDSDGTGIISFEDFRGAIKQSLDCTEDNKFSKMITEDVSAIDNTEVEEKKIV